MDVANSFFPMDLSGMPVQGEGLANGAAANGQPQQQQQPQPNSANFFASNSGPFMGVSRTLQSVAAMADQYVAGAAGSEAIVGGGLRDGVFDTKNNVMMKD